MSFGSFDEHRPSAPMAEINVTPMVDVMLVLLVIFILAAPLFTHAIKLDLPQANAAPAATLPQTITLSIDAAGKLYWNDQAVDAAQLTTRMVAAAHQQPTPDLQLRADRASRYEVIARVMAAAQSSGLTKIGFVTEPQPVSGAPTAPGATGASGADGRIGVSSAPGAAAPGPAAASAVPAAAPVAPAAIQSTPAAGLQISPALTASKGK